MPSINHRINPSRISDQHNFSVTPFGVFCLECNKPVGDHNNDATADMLRMHNKHNGHSRIDEETTYSEVAESLNKEKNNEYGHIRNYYPWIVEENIPTLKCSCGKLFNDRSNLRKHCKLKATKGDGGNHTPEDTRAVVTTCGRTIEESIIMTMTNAPSQVDVSNSNTSGSALSTSDTDTIIPSLSPTTTPSVEATSVVATSKYIPLQSSNKRWINNTLENVNTIFSPFKRPDESLESYLPSLKLMMLNYNHPIITNITNDLKSLEDESPRQRNVLDFFIDWVQVR